MKLTYYGHSCFLLETTQGHKLLFDPFVSGNETAQKQGVNRQTLIDIRPTYILLSHAHEDHTLDAEAVSKATKAPIVGVWEIHQYYTKCGCATVPLNVGGTLHHTNKQESSLSVKLVPAIHSSSFADGSYGGVPVGFVVREGDYTLYYAGDTCLNLEMELIAEQYQLDLAILPIGGTFTMDVEDAVEAALLLDVEHVVGVHYDTFEPIKIDKEEAKKKFDEVGIQLHLLEVGASLDIGALQKAPEEAK